MSAKEDANSIVNDAIIKEIAQAASALRYGYIQIVVHDSRIVQVDKTEKKRFDDVWRIEKGGGI